MVREWRRYKEVLKKSEKNKHSFCNHTAKWPNLEAEMKNWITDHINNGICVYKNDNF
jgi:peptidoglycan/xylan/chitin deacetylase (PgdA/CDA1 family)